MKKILLLLIPISFVLTTQAQLVIVDEPNDTTFIYSIAGPGVTISNLTRTCADGASGYFNSLTSNAGIDSGLVLTSGAATNAIGPNNQSGIGGMNGFAGDADLDAAIPGYFTYDACVIEFDMTVMADTARISYVFGSEEYLEYVGSSFNDVFAFWVSGPGITDTLNAATIPGTDIAVAINNVNNLSYSEYFVHNGDGYEEPFASDPFYLQYDGMTVVLEAKAPTIPGETYHMKIAIADAGDAILDSGVFLETGSLGSLRMGTNYYGDGYSVKAEENCSNGYLEFINYLPGLEDLVFDYHISGTAMNGVDFEVISEQITIPAGMSTAVLPIVPINDTELEGDETIILDLFNPQSGYIYSTIEMVLKDALQSDFTFAGSDATYDFININPDAVLWNWNFGDGTTSTEENPSHTFATEGTYNVCLNIFNENNCEANTCKQVSTSTAIQQLPELASLVSIYPNPTQAYFTIEIPNAIQFATFSIKNIIGGLFYTSELTETSKKVNCENWPSGIYLIEIQTANGSFVKTIEVK